MLIAPLALVGAASSATSVASASVGTVKEFTGWVGSLFGGRPDWYRDAAAGKLAPSPNPIAPIIGHDIPADYAYIRRIEPSELLAALQSAPRGNPGVLGPGGLTDPTKGTVEGLRSALLYGHKELAPYLTSLDALANAGAYTAHGTYNGDAANWSNRPAAEHSVYLIHNYRKRLEAQQRAQQLAGGVGSIVNAVANGNPSGLPVGVLAIAGAVLLWKIL